MKKVIIYLIYALILGSLIGCGGGGGSNNSADEVVKVNKEYFKGFEPELCKDNSSESCKDASKIYDFKKLNVVALKTPKELAAPIYSGYDGKRFIAVPKGEKEVSPLKALAYAMYKVGTCKSCPYKEDLLSIKGTEKILKDYYKLTGTTTQQNAILALFNHNMELLSHYKIDIKEAHQKAWDALAKKIISLSKKDKKSYDLSELRAIYRGDRPIAVVLSKNDIPVKNGISDFLLGLNEIGVIAELQIKPMARVYFNNIYNSYECPRGQIKDFYLFGLYDDFLTNNIEPLHPRADVVNLFYYSGSGNTPSYDIETTPYNTNWVVETIKTIPSNITQGKFVVSFVNQKSARENRYFISDNIAIYPESSSKTISGPTATLQNSWSNPYPKVYTKDISLLIDGDNTSLLNKIQNGLEKFDVGFYPNVKVDYMALIVCKQKVDIPVGMKCDENNGEFLYTIDGGIYDDFEAPIENATPSNTLVLNYGATSNHYYKNYDQILAARYPLLDTITIPSGVTVVKSEFYINVNDIDYNSDFFTIGDLTNNNIGITVPFSNSNYFITDTSNNGKLYRVSGNENVYDSSGNELGNLTHLINSSGKLDIVVKGLANVDFSRLNLCLKKEDENNETQGDIAIDKNVTNIEEENGAYIITYLISFSGSLPPGEPLVIEDTIPYGGTIISINANGWNCSNTPIGYPNNLHCSIQGAQDPIPPIEIKMGLKDVNSTRNCVKIIKGSETDYNTNSSNDVSCADANISSETEIPESCNKLQLIDLSDANNWVNNSGQHPVVNNAVPSVWDNSMNWFYLGQPSFTEKVLNLKFCVCGNTKIAVDDLKSDNYSKIYLDDDPTPNDYANSSYIAYRNLNSQETMANWGPVASGSLYLPYAYDGTAINHTLHIKVKNIREWMGVAVKGTLEFLGHLGECTSEDNKNR